MNIGAMQILAGTKKINTQQVLTTADDVKLQGEQSFLSMLGDFLEGQNNEEANLNIPLNIVDDTEGDFFKSLKLFVKEIPYDLAYLNKEMLETAEVEDLLSALPEELVIDIKDLFDKGIPIDVLIDSQDFNYNQAHFISLIIMLTRNDVKVDHEIGEQINKKAEQLFVLLKSEKNDANPIIAQLFKERSFDVQEILNRLNSTNSNNVSTLSLFNSTGTVLSPIHQFVIHVGEQNQQVSQQQFIRQFQEVLGRSNLKNFQNGNNHLSIKLYPEHLGRLDVRLTQINGAIVATIMTSSIAARELVESQLQLLRQAFIGQQLNVERIEISQQQVGQTFKEQNNKQSQHESNPEEQRKDKENKDQEESFFSDFLEEITINEEV